MRKNKTEKATFAAGCFWGVEKIFYETSGVLKTRVGYTGGIAKYENPTYEEVCTNQTGHVEAVEITFNPEKISFEKLLVIFWMIHDPTTLNQQGPDIGSQYRSAIFYHNNLQKKAAVESKEALQNKMSRKIITEIAPADFFYPAEKYHQKYFLTHPVVCHINPYLK